MKKNIVTSLVVLAIVALAFFLIFFAGKNILPTLLGTTTNTEVVTPAEDGKILNKKAPNFDLPDNAGDRVKLNTFLNTPVVLVFWATWNSESSDQVKILDDYLLSNNIQTSLVKVLAVDSLEDASVVKSFVRRGGYKVPILLDVTGDTSNRYNVKSLPAIYFIGKDGFVKEIYTGVMSESMIVDKVENLLK